MSTWWHKYKDSPSTLKHLVQRMVDMSDKLEEEWWIKRAKLLDSRGISGLNKRNREKFWDLGKQCHKQISPIWEDLAEITSYISINNL